MKVRWHGSNGRVVCLEKRKGGLELEVFLVSILVFCLNGFGVSLHVRRTYGLVSFGVFMVITGVFLTHLMVSLKTLHGALFCLRYIGSKTKVLTFFLYVVESLAMGLLLGSGKTLGMVTPHLRSNFLAFTT